MKKYINNRLLPSIVTFVILMTSQLTSATIYDFMVDGICYSINRDSISVSVTPENGPYLDTGPAYSNITGDVVIPESVTFNNISYHVTAIKDFAFNKCSDITSVTIPNNVTSIGDQAFEECRDLKTVVLPDSLARFGYCAFRNCISLENVNLPSKYNAIGIGYGILSGCTALTDIVIPDSYKIIFDAMFARCVNLTNVRLPKKLESIFPSAFSGCSSLTYLNLPPTLKFIGSYAFRGCSSLVDLDLPQNLQFIPDYAFADCSNLTSIQLPARIRELGYGVFDGCTAMRKLTCLAMTPPKAHEDEDGYEGQFYIVWPGTFNGIDKENCVLRVFESAMQDYHRAKGWRLFQQYEAVNENEHIPGDINGDGVVDIADVNGVINDILGKADIVIQVDDVKFGLARVEGGMFNMGTSDYTEDLLNWGGYDYLPSPVHQVQLNSFYISTTEVTQQLYHALMGGVEPEYEKRFCPVYNINWNQAQAFMQRLSARTGLPFRLPTEAEWEFAARGGIKSQGYSYSGSNNCTEVAYCTYTPWGPTEQHGPYAVGGLKPNELGIYDMSGNVWEWCQDWFAEYTEEAQVNPIGADTGTKRVIRGGSCYNERPESRCNVYNRAAVEPIKTVYSSNNEPIGIRLALDNRQHIVNNACDVTGDGIVDIADLNTIINIMLGRSSYDIPTSNQGHVTAPTRNR